MACPKLQDATTRAETIAVAQWRKAVGLLPEEFLDFPDDFHEAVHFSFGIVKVKTGASGGFNTELVHERLSAVMSAAQRDACLVGEGHDVVGVNVLEQKADEAGMQAGSGLWAEEADVIQRGEFLVGIGGEVAVMVPDILAADAVEVIHRDAEADGARDVRRAGFELVRRLFEFGFVVADAKNHLAAALVGRHGVEKLLAAIQNADAGGPANLVAGKGKEIAADGLDIHGTMASALRTVHDGDDAALAGASAKLGNGIEGAKGIGDMHHRENLHTARKERIELRQIEQAFIAIDGHVGDFCTSALGHKLPRHEIAVMFHFREENDVALLKIFHAPGAGHEVDAFGGAAREDDFVRHFGIDEPAGASASFLEGGSSAIAQLMDAAMDVGVIAFVIVDEGVNDGPGFLGRSGVVEID